MTEQDPHMIDSLTELALCFGAIDKEHRTKFVQNLLIAGNKVIDQSNLTLFPKFIGKTIIPSLNTHVSQHNCCTSSKSTTNRSTSQFRPNLQLVFVNYRFSLSKFQRSNHYKRDFFFLLIIPRYILLLTIESYTSAVKFANLLIFPTALILVIL